MRLALSHQVVDWRSFRDELPAVVFEGWKAFHTREPWGTQHFYEFLARSFVKLIQGFHNLEFAGEVTWRDFVWWAADDEWDADGGLDDDQIGMWMDSCDRTYGPDGNGPLPDSLSRDSETPDSESRATNEGEPDAVTRRGTDGPEPAVRQQLPSQQPDGRGAR